MAGSHTSMSGSPVFVPRQVPCSPDGTRLPMPCLHFSGHQARDICCCHLELHPLSPLRESQAWAVCSQRAWLPQGLSHKVGRCNPGVTCSAGWIWAHRIEWARVGKSGQEAGTIHIPLPHPRTCLLNTARKCFVDTHSVEAFHGRCQPYRWQSWS